MKILLNQTTPPPTQALWSQTATTVDRPVATPKTIASRLKAHLRSWLGAWPATERLDLIVWPGREEPGWDGGYWPGLGVASPSGTVFSLAPRIGFDVAALNGERVAAALDSPAAATAVPAALGRPDLTLTRAAFRWSEKPATLPAIGEWVDRDDPRLPPWLRPFNGGVVAAWDDAGKLAAGVGIKRHNAFGHELSVGTEPAHRGKGLAAALVAQAADRVLAAGAVPLYLHDYENAASAHVAARSGFPDRGWSVIGLLPEVHPAP